MNERIWALGPQREQLLRPIPTQAAHRCWEGCSSAATLSSQNFLMVSVASAWSALGTTGAVWGIRGRYPSRPPNPKPQGRVEMGDPPSLEEAQSHGEEGKKPHR